MINAVRTHYETVLARHYTKLAGDFETASTGQIALLETLGVRAKSGMRVVDLGCGAGLQSVPLARRGCVVTAVDLSPTLLAELKRRQGELPITTVEQDLVAFMQLPREDRFDLALCMGDTLPHLPNASAIADLFEATAAKLAPGARFVLTFRDLTTTRTNLDRFILLVAEPDLLMRCFLEYHPDHVVVHDLIDERVDGTWHQAIGAYPKLRLDLDWVTQCLCTTGFANIQATEVNGVHRIVASR